MFICGIADLGWIEQRECAAVENVKDDYRKKCPDCHGDECLNVQARRRAIMLEDGGY